ncbi:MAG TPA: NAD(P)/FAD-dependent oxidoreductase [Labilithrix sp.]|nr:NAD(P)/FAD-dependent oxidoreductase [Labilithrix sp.]
MRPLDVGIIGAGTAGSAAALFLARAGHRVTVYERVPTPAAVGAGITLQPTGLHVLHRLGLDAEVVSHGARIDRLFCESSSRTPLVDLSYATIGEGLFGLGLHRGVLFEALFGAAARQSGVTMLTGREIVDLARAEPPRAGARSRWSWFVDVHRERHGPHELVVVADGARSQLRDDTNTSKVVERYPWGALWFVGRQPYDEPHPMTRTLHQVVDGNQRFLGFLPTGFGPALSRTGARPERLVSLFWSIRGDRVTEWRERGLDAWKSSVSALAKEAEPVLDQIHDEAQVLFAAYHDVVMHRWHTRNVVYLGDAAHATSPQLGQGCNLALWDAMELHDCLAEEPRDLALALSRYSRRREEHLGFYQTATRWLTPFFQGDVEALGRLRDIAMPLMGKVSPMNRLMTLSMLGVVDGFFGRTLTLRLPSGTLG